jgi:hypothetical protein
MKKLVSDVRWDGRPPKEALLVSKQNKRRPPRSATAPDNRRDPGHRRSI